MVTGVFDDKLTEAIAKSRILVIGAGGIGCEILKNLVLTGFPKIEIIDLDTIEVSNLNRQFLFHKEHVGKSKAQVAKDSALSFNPKVDIVAHHDSIISQDYGVGYFKQFSLVLNALDNRAARNHVNRLCLAADIPLVETGTAGYAGQVELIKKGIVQCYECQPQKAQTTFPGCTIRNTPSEPIHCIVWSKHLFNQLFGDEDPDQAVSPDSADPEAVGDAGADALTSESKDGNVERMSTRNWVATVDYDAKKLFAKFFGDDIRYLLSMKNLWTTRQPPTPLNWNELPGKDEPETKHTGLLGHQVWTIRECVKVFADCCKKLKDRLSNRPSGDHLVWDKDDNADMDFVAACANIRAYIFNILPLKSRFEIKSMAGNIIPAIASANAIVAGIAVLRAQSILKGEINNCTSVFLRSKVNHCGYMLVSEKTLTPPNPFCYVCSPKPEVGLACNIKQLTLKDLNMAFREGLHMQAPDATLEGKGLIVLSSEPGETDHNNDKTLTDLGLDDGCALMVDDYLQNYEVRVRIQQDDDEKLWRLVTGEGSEMPAPKEVPVAENANNKSEPKAGPSKAKRHDSESDLEIIDEDEEVVKPAKRRRIQVTGEVMEIL